MQAAVDLTLEDFVRTALAPGATAAAIGLALSLLAGRGRRGAWILGLSVAGGALVGQIRTDGFPTFPPGDGIRWIPFLVAGVLALFATDDALGFRPVPRLLARLAALGAAVSALSLPLAARWERNETAIHFAIPIAAGLVVWVSLDRLARERKAAAGTVALLVAATGASLANLFAYSARIAQLGGGLASAFGAATAVALVFRSRPLGRTAAAVGVTVLLSHLLGGVLYSYLPVASAALLLATPLAVGLAPRRRPEEPATIRSLLVVGVAAAIPAAIAVWLAVPPSDY